MRKKYVELIEKHYALAESQVLQRTMDNSKMALIYAVKDSDNLLLYKYSFSRYYDGSSLGAVLGFILAIDGAANFAVSFSSSYGSHYSFEAIKNKYYLTAFSFYGDSEAVIKDYLIANESTFGVYNGEDVISFISQWQSSRANTPLTRKHKKDADNLKNYMSQLKPLPKNLEDWIDSELFTTAYGIYRKKSDKTAICTHCGAEIWSPSIGHNGQSYCRCGKHIVYKNTGIVSKMHSIPDETMDFAYLQGLGESICIRVCRVTKEYDSDEGIDYCKFSYDINEVMRVFVDKKGTHIYKCNDFISAMRVFAKNWYASRVCDYSVDMICQDDLDAEIALSPFKHSSFVELMAAATTVRLYHYIPRIVEFFTSYKKAPIIESCIKLGLFELANSIISNKVQLAGNNFKNAFGISANWIPLIKKYGITYYNLEALRLFKTVDAADKIYGAILADCRYELCTVLKYLSEKRIISYILPKCRNRSVFLRDYADYIQQCNLLSYDMTDKNILMPKNFETAHAKTNILVKYKEDSKKDAALADVYKKCEKALTLEVSDYIVRPVATQLELVTEGEMLHHCVGGYLDQIIQGRCYICFVRKKTAPETPFFTMELTKELTLIQCRTKNNRSYTENADISTVVAAYLATIQKNSKKAVAQC